MRRHAKAIVAAISVLLLTLALSATLATAVAPVVTIEDASDISYGTADVKGTVNPEGQLTTWRFQYIADAQFQENLTNSLPGFEGANTPFEESTEAEETLERELSFLNPGTTYHLRLVAENVDGQSEAVATNTFTTKTVGPPSVTIDPVTTFDGTTAKFTGTVDPEAPEEGPGEFPEEFNAEWAFECTPECSGLQFETIPADSDPHTVEAEVTGLEPNTSYEVTLIARNTGGEVSAGPESFKTEAVAPDVQTLYAGYVTETTATLAANVNPRNSPATYQFEWGADESYGNLAPATPQSLGAEDNSFHVVTAPITGLQPGETYHFRVVATNTETSQVTQGEDLSFLTLSPSSPVAPCPNTAMRVGTSAKLPECRAYEKVSPNEKGADIAPGGVARAAAEGDAVAYQSFGSFDSGTPSRGFYNEYLSRRGADGWGFRGINLPQDQSPSLTVPQGYEALAPDLSSGIAYSWSLQDSGNPQTKNLWKINTGDLTSDLLSAPLIPVDPEIPPFSATLGNHFAGANSDFSHIVFHSRTPLVAGAPSAGIGLYEWDEGELRYAAILPEDEGGTLVDGASLGYGNPYDGDSKYPGDNAVSADGSRVFFSSGFSPNSPRQLYVRENGITTRLVSASERTDCAGDPTCGGDGIPDPAPDPSSSYVNFQLASPDGKVAFFTSGRKLTDSATARESSKETILSDDSCAKIIWCDLYRWDGQAPEGNRLTDLTTADPEGARVMTVIGASGQADTLYFVAAGVLAAGAQPNQANLYVWREGVGIDFISTLGPEDNPSGDEPAWSRSLNNGEFERGHFSFARITPNGRYLLFRSATRVTAYDNDGFDQLYLYDSVSKTLECVSCSKQTARSGGQAFLKRQQGAVVRPPWLARNISADGSRVFFESVEPLVASDTNGRIDVYVWADRGVRLISSGQAPDHSVFLDASASGDDVFFTTRQRLVGADIGDEVDLYDARVGGGLEERVPPQPCEGDSCQPPPVVPNDPTPASAGFAGPGDRSAVRPRAKCGKNRVRRRGRCVKRRKSASKGSTHNRRASR